MNQPDSQDSLAYASAKRRLATWIVDGALIMACQFALEKVISAPDIVTIMSILGALLYEVLMQSSRYQATLGQILLKTYVADTQNRRLSISTALIRYLVYLAPMMPGFFIMLKPEFTAYSKISPFHENEYAAYMSVPANVAFLDTLKSTYIYGFAGDLLLLALPIMLTKQKTGIHDLLSQSRVFRRT
jgi:uncharacterized RDD family membrane protein YckC